MYCHSDQCTGAAAVLEDKYIRMVQCTAADVFGAEFTETHHVEATEGFSGYFGR